MPHVITEYSANLEGVVDVPRLVKELHETAIASGLFQVGGIRSRAKKRDIYVVADGDPSNAFVYVVARIAPGRPIEKRKALGEALLASASKRLDPVFKSRGLSLSVEVQELDEQLTFRKNNLHERLAAKKGAAA
ncbi:MAG TPA: 5-carboxymethyl-2-hydroxymuconate Delta-isomerase [Xanthobacteraceae bacterium]|jgi:5-carboxymethyl-2-hydroxymuconate isomerase